MSFFTELKRSNVFRVGAGLLPILILVWAFELTSEGVKRDHQFDRSQLDLEATPDFRARLQEAGFGWPPSTPVNYPLKSW